jgi:tetratricopeptide (TPR) repeat protein
METGRIQQLREKFRGALAHRLLLDAGGAYDLLRQMDPGLSSPAFEEDRGQLAAQLEDEGQRVISWYVGGDDFALDPSAVQQREFQRGKELFDRAARLRPATEPEWQDLSARAWFCQGRALMYDKQYDQAVTAFEKARQADPNAAEPCNAVGIIELERAHYDSAREWLRKAIDLAPHWTFPRHNLALTYVESGDYNSALHEYRAAIELTPYFPYLHYNLGLLLQRLNQKSDAASEYRKALRLFTEEMNEYTERAARWTKAQERDEADHAARKAEILGKHRAEVFNAIGALKEAQGRPKAAEREYLYALKIDDKLTIARHNLGLLAAKQKNGSTCQEPTTAAASNSQHVKLACTDLAIHYWTENLGLEETFLPSRLSLAEAYLRKLEFDKAAEHYREAIRQQVEARKDPSAATRVNYAHALYCVGNSADALKQLRQATARESGDAAAHELLGDLYSTSGDADSALAEYNTARQIRSAEKPRRRQVDKSGQRAPAAPWDCKPRK